MSDKKSIYSEIQWDSLVDHITDNHGLTDPTTQGIIERMNDYVIELREDKQRLDWLFSEESNTNIEVGRYGRGDEYKPWVVDTLHNRQDIDEAMGGAG